MGAEGIESFKAGLRMQESGSYEGNYEQRGRWKNGDGEVGAYGILYSNFEMWAREAGYGGADWRDDEVQDIIITKKLEEYYEEFRDWDLVAYAWIGGPDFARKVQVNEYVSSAKFEGKPVSDMANSILANMKSSPSEYASEPDEMPFTPENPPKRKMPKKAGVVGAKEQLVELFDNWGTELAGGQRVDYRTLGDEPDDELAKVMEEEEEVPDGNIETGV